MTLLLELILVASVALLLILPRRLRLATRVLLASTVGGAFLIVSLVLLQRIGDPPPEAPSTVEVAPNELPMLLISYAYSISRDVEITAAVETPLGRTYRALEQRLEGLRVDLPTKLGFVHEAFVVQPRTVGSRAIGKPGESTLYVTEPLPQFGEAVVVVVSSVSPEMTTVFQVDRQLNVRLIYDSLVASPAGVGSSCGPLGQINGAEASPEGNLVLTESNARWSRDHSRKAVLNLSKEVPIVDCTVR